MASEENIRNNPVLFEIRQRARRVLDEQINTVNRKMMARHESYVEQRTRIAIEKQAREIAAKGPQALQWRAKYHAKKAKYYYHNTATGQTVWRKPISYVLQADETLMRKAVQIQLLYRAVTCRRKLREALLEVKDDAEWQIRRARGMAIIGRQLDRVNAEKAAVNKQAEEYLADLQKQLGDGDQEWVESYDPDEEKFYYYNAKTQETTWTKPETYVMAADNKLMVACLKLQCVYRAKKAREALKRRMYEDAKLDPELQKKYDPMQFKKDVEVKKKAEENLLAQMLRDEVNARHKPWEPPSR